MAPPRPAWAPSRTHTLSTRSPSCCTATAVSLAFLGLGFICSSVSAVYLQHAGNARNGGAMRLGEVASVHPTVHAAARAQSASAGMMGTAAAMHAAIIIANLRSLSAHSLAISSAPLLPPLLTVSTVMGMGRTLRASDDCCCCRAAGAGGVARAAAKSGAAPARCSCQVPLAAALQVRAELIAV